LFFGFIFYRAADLKTLATVKDISVLGRSVDFLVGAILGATMAHFVIDAGAWRLSKMAQRAYMTRRFGFLLQHRPAPEARESAR